MLKLKKNMTPEETLQRYYNDELTFEQAVELIEEYYRKPMMKTPVIHIYPKERERIDGFIKRSVKPIHRFSIHL